MIDIYSITYPIGVKRYIRVNENTPDIIEYLYEHAEPVTCKSLSSALNIPNKPTLTILTNLYNYGILERESVGRYGTTSVYSYSLNAAYRFKLNEAAAKRQASVAVGGVAV